MKLGVLFLILGNLLALLGIHLIIIRHVRIAAGRDQIQAILQLFQPSRLYRQRKRLNRLAALQAQAVNAGQFLAGLGAFLIRRIAQR